MYDSLVRYRSFIGRSVWAIAGQVATVVFTLAGTRLVTQFLDPGLYGTVNLLQNAILLLRTLFCSPILNTGLRFYPEAERGQYLKVFRVHLLRGMMRALIAVEVLAIAGGLVYLRRLGVTPLMVVGIAVYAASDVVRTLEVTLLGAAQRQRPVASLTSFENLIRPLLIVGGVILFGASVSAVLGAMALSILLTLVSIYVFVRRDSEGGDAAIPAKIVDQMQRFAIPLIPVAALNWVTSLSDRYIIEWFTHDAAAIGVYAAGYGLASAPLMVINGVVLMVLRPVYFATESHGDYHRAERTFVIWSMTTGICCLAAAGLIFLTRSFIVTAFLGPQYRNAVTVIPWIGLGYAFYAVEQVLEQKMLAKKRSAAVLISQTAGGVASVVITIPLVMKFGMMGAAYACPIYFFLQFAVAAAVLRTPKARNSTSPRSAVTP